MEFISKLVFFLLICSAVSCAACSDSAQEVLIYRGASDASAAVAVGEEMFVVADDENNVLRVYRTDKESLPVFSYDLTEFLGTSPQRPEADIEGATMVGNRIYWITSHGRNKDGKMRPNRYRFFATDVKVQDDDVTVSHVGIPCRTLIHALVKTDIMRPLELDKATRLDALNLTKIERKKLAPKEEGLNIEGLCASADGNTIYIGFRNPRPQSKTLLVPLSNPKEVIEKQQPPIFEEPILWDLKGLGIRSMEYSHFHKAYFIIAGPHNQRQGFVLYRWSGERDSPPVLIQQILLEKDNFSPEALVTFKTEERFLLLSDDGTLLIEVSDDSECMQGKLSEDGKCLQKYLTDQNKKCFRGIWLRP